MPELLHVVFDPIRYEELDCHAVGARNYSDRNYGDRSENS
jgi:hypothetical protein